MKNDNYYNFTIFERICLILHGLLHVISFIYALQFIFISRNIIISILCLIFCIISFGYYLAQQKISEKDGHLLELEEDYHKLLEKYLDINKKEEK